MNDAFANHRGQPTPLARAMSVAGAFLILTLCFLGASPELHTLIHSDCADHSADCDHSGHNCIVTDFASGGAWVDVVTIQVEPMTLMVETAMCTGNGQRLSLLKFRLRPICGPPSQYS